MATLLVCYEKDLPSANMKEQLLRKCEWEDCGTDGENSYLRCDDMCIMTIPEKHLLSDHVDQKAKAHGISVDNVVFMSRHSAASGMPTLTVHPIGNYGTADLGGMDRRLVRSAPHLMTNALRRIKALNDTIEYNVSFEVTHHGPYLESPTMFIEIGSEETHWGDVHAAEILADVILSMRSDEDHPAVIGVGGGHYAPRFTELALTKKVSVGHMVPVYRIVGSSDDELTEMISNAAKSTGTDMVYVHRKSMKGAEERRVNAIIDTLGLERVGSESLDPL